MYNKLDTYLNLCTEVYEISKPIPPQDVYEFYRSYAVSACGPILEPMCGTGRFLIPLTEEGFNIHGFDASKYMLQKLIQKAEIKNLSPNVWQGFIENLNIINRYDLIFIPSGSFGLLHDDVIASKALKILYNHLIDGGYFVFEAETNASLPPLGTWQQSTWTKGDGKIILLSQCASLEDNVCSSICRYELIENGNIIYTEIENLKVRLYSPQELVRNLKEIGFSSIRSIRAFNKNLSPREDDKVIIYECRK